MKFILFSLALIFLSSCSGYKVRTKSNPFKKQGVNSIAFVQFVNKTPINGLSQKLSREAFEVLSRYPDLKVSAGNLKNEDAVVLGIIRSASNKKSPLLLESKTLMNSEQRDAIGSRNAFYLPTQGVVYINVEFIVIKRPTREEVEFYKNFFNIPKTAFPNVIFNRNFVLSSSYTIENTTGGVDSVESIIQTKNRGNLQSAISKMAESFSNELEEVFINAN